VKVLVTGGAGYIGSVCVERLLDHGAEVVVLDDLSTGHREAVDQRARFFQGDLLDQAWVRDLVSREAPDAVLHFAGKALVEESMREPGRYFQGNFSAGVSLLESVREAGVRKVVFSSTCAVYGLPEKIPIDERATTRPINPYGASKLMFEEVLRWYEKVHGISWVSLRYFNAAGASERFGEDHRNETHLIPRVLQVALRQRKSIEVYGTDHPTLDGTCIRDYIHVLDLAEAHWLALGCEKSCCYNLGIGSGYSVLQVIEAARKVTGHPIPLERKPKRPGDPPRLVASANKIARELGWKPGFIRLEEIIDTAWQWHRTHPFGYRE
jgi:UDP-glucose 4-epimerase